MLHDDDLDAAVAAGIVTDAQAISLRTLAATRERERAVALGHEERFQFMRSFNDFFFAIGVALLGGGLAFFTAGIPAASLVAAAIVWALAELLVARMRLVLPGILLSCFFVAFILLASPIDFWFMSSPQQQPGFDAFRDWFTSVRRLRGGDSTVMTLSVYGLAGAAAAGLFYARFRLPFALLLVASGLIVSVLAAVHHYWPGPMKLIESLLLLGCGLVVFAAAMAFDASDRERLTRRADCAFWLHLLAAPLIVHSLIELVWLRTPGSRLATAGMSTEVAAAIALIVAVLALVAITIDRRALFVSALTYLGIVIGYAITGTIGRQAADQSFVFFATLIVLGALVVALGVGWQPVRRRLVALLSPTLAGRLPPVVPAR